MVVCVLPNLSAVVDRIPGEEGIRRSWVPINFGGAVINAGGLVLAELHRRDSAWSSSRRKHLGPVRTRIEGEVGLDCRVHGNWRGNADLSFAGAEGWDKSKFRNPQALAQALIVGKKEEPVPADRSACRCSKLIAFKGRDRSLWIIKEVLGVERRIAQELINAPVQRVGAGLADRVDEASHGATVLGAGVVGDNLKLPDGLDPKELSAGAAWGEVLGVVDVGAIQQKQIGGQAGPAD